MNRTTPARRAYYSHRQVERWAEFRNVPIMKENPIHHDEDMSLVHGMLIAGIGQGVNVDQLAHVMLEAHWVEGADLTDRQTLSRLGAKAGFEAEPGGGYYSPETARKPSEALGGLPNSSTAVHDSTVTWPPSCRSPGALGFRVLQTQKGERRSPDPFLCRRWHGFTGAVHEDIWPVVDSALARPRHDHVRGPDIAGQDSGLPRRQSEGGPATGS